LLKRILKRRYLRMSSLIGWIKRKYYAFLTKRRLKKMRKQDPFIYK